MADVASLQLRTTTEDLRKQQEELDRKAADLERREKQFQQNLNTSCGFLFMHLNFVHKFNFSLHNNFKKYHHNLHSITQFTTLENKPQHHKLLYKLSNCGPQQQESTTFLLCPTGFPSSPASTRTSTSISPHSCKRLCATTSTSGWVSGGVACVIPSYFFGFHPFPIPLMD